MTNDIPLTRLTDLAGPVILFPVRHHSPAAARLVGELIDRVKPAAVLIEGPADFNPRLAELALPHRLPVAVYSYLVVRSAATGADKRVGVYYPFCDHSPEWQAVRRGAAAGAAVRFVDLPWANLAMLPADAGDAPRTNRYADAHLSGSRFLARVAAALGVDSFHDVWDALFEIDPDLTLDDYLARCHRLCAQMRLADGRVGAADAAREAYMAGHVRAAVAEFAGPVVVVTGGYHSLGLLELLDRPAPPAAELADPGAAVTERGVALTPYSFERLDALAGYDSGMPNPGFYHRLWHARLTGTADIHRDLLRAVVDHLRDRNQQISSADLIAAETTARALALVRGHPVVWRTDLLDGLTGALVKDDTPAGAVHPVLAAAYLILRGGERGRLADGTARPPLVDAIEAEITRLNLAAGGPQRVVSLTLMDPAGRDRSRTLHRLRLLEIAGYTLTNSTLTRPNAPEPVEDWSVTWSPDFDAGCIEASRYGAALPEAAAAKLAETAAGVDRDAALAARLLLDAALAGLDAVSGELLATVRRLVHTDASFPAVAGALGTLVFLYRYDLVLGTSGRADLGELLREAFARGLWLLESGGGQDRSTLDGVKGLVEAFERCDHELSLDRAEFAAALARVSAERSNGPLVRGATLGGLWVLGEADGDAVTARLNDFLDPADVGDFLAGVFALAREQAQRQRGLLLGIHKVLGGYGTEQFLAALPALRLAFTYFTPREKHQLARTLRGALNLEAEPEIASLTVSADTAAQAMRFEDRLFSTAAKLGIRVTP